MTRVTVATGPILTAAQSVRGFKFIKNVAALFADTEYTYQPGRNGTVVPGDTIVTLEEGLSYDVIAAGASTPTQTAGGVKLRALAERGELSSSAFGNTETALVAAMQRAATIGARLVIDADYTVETANAHEIVIPAGGRLRVRQQGRVFFDLPSALGTGIAIRAAIAAETTLAEPVTAFDRTIEVASAAGIEAGMLLRFETRTMFETGWHRQYQGAFTVVSVSGNVITLDRPVPFYIGVDNEVVYTGNGSATAYWYTGGWLVDAGDIEVEVDGVLQTLTTDYTLAFKNGVDAREGYTVTFTSAPGNGDPVLIRSVPVSITVHHPSALEWHGGKLEGNQPGSGSENPGTTYLDLTGIQGATFEDLSTAGAQDVQNGDHLRLTLCTGARFRGVRQINGRYAIHSRGSFGTVVDGLHAENVRHPFEPQGWTDTAWINGLTAVRCHGPIDAHPSFEIHYRDVSGDHNTGRMNLRGTSGSVTNYRGVGIDDAGFLGRMIGTEWIDDPLQDNPPASYWQERGDFRFENVTYKALANNLRVNIRSGGIVSFIDCDIECVDFGSIGSTGNLAPDFYATGCRELRLIRSRIKGRVDAKAMRRFLIEGGEIDGNIELSSAAQRALNFFRGDGATLRGTNCIADDRGQTVGGPGGASVREFIRCRFAPTGTFGANIPAASAQARIYRMVECEFDGITAMAANWFYQLHNLRIEAPVFTNRAAVGGAATSLTALRPKATGATPNANGGGLVLLENASAADVFNPEGRHEGLVVIFEVEDGNTTFKHGTNLRLAGSADFNPAAEGRLTLVREAGKWREIARVTP